MLKTSTRSCPDRPSLLLVHGGMGSFRHWDRNIEKLSERFSVSAPDLPGFGDAPDAPADGDAAFFAQALARHLDARSSPAGGVHLAGFSFGGVIGAHFAARLPERVERLTLIGPGGFGPAPRGRFDLRRQTETSDGEIIKHNLLQTMLHAPGAADAKAVEIQRQNLARTRFDSRDISTRPSLLENLTAIKCPAQILWGEYDVLAYPSVAERMARCREANPSLELITVPNSGHWAQYENPDFVNREIIRFHLGAHAIQ